ncbi:hypothetical protein WJX79_001345 [Trebouxia sp. C0005]
MGGNVPARRGAPRPPQPHVTAMLSARAASVPGAARQGLRDQPEARRLCSSGAGSPAGATAAALAAAWPDAIEAPGPLTDLSVAASNRHP